MRKGLASVSSACTLVLAGGLKLEADGDHEAKLGLQHHEDIKKSILEQVEKAKAKLVRKKLKKGEDDTQVKESEGAEVVCSALEAMLMHGLLATPDTRSHDIWQLVLNWAPDHVADELALAHNHCPVGMTRGYVRDMLNTPGAPMNLLNTLQGEADAERILEEAYKAYALLRDEDKMARLLTTVDVMQQVLKFDLKTDNPALRIQWSYLARSLVNGWAPVPLPPSPSSSPSQLPLTVEHVAQKENNPEAKKTQKKNTVPVRVPDIAEGTGGGLGCAIPWTSYTSLRSSTSGVVSDTSFYRDLLEPSEERRRRSVESGRGLLVERVQEADPVNASFPTSAAQSMLEATRSERLGNVSSAEKSENVSSAEKSENVSSAETPQNVSSMPSLNREGSDDTCSVIIETDKVDSEDIKEQKSQEASDQTSEVEGVCTESDDAVLRAREDSDDFEDIYARGSDDASNVEDFEEDPEDLTPAEEALSLILTKDEDDDEDFEDIYAPNLQNLEDALAQENLLKEHVVIASKCSLTVWTESAEAGSERTELADFDEASASEETKLLEVSSAPEQRTEPNTNSEDSAQESSTSELIKDLEEEAASTTTTVAAPALAEEKGLTSSSTEEEDSLEQRRLAMQVNLEHRIHTDTDWVTVSAAAADAVAHRPDYRKQFEETVVAIRHTLEKIEARRRAKEEEAEKLAKSPVRRLFAKTMGSLKRIMRVHPLEKEQLQKRQEEFLEYYTSEYVLSTEPITEEANLCGVCRMTLEKGRIGMCHMSGQRCCMYCHSNEKAIIPYKIMKNFDFEKYPVCDLAYKFLDTSQSKVWIDDFCIRPGDETKFASQTATVTCLRGRVVMQVWTLGKENAREVILKPQQRLADITPDTAKHLRLFSVKELVMVRKKKLHNLLVRTLKKMDTEVNRVSVERIIDSPQITEVTEGGGA